MKNGVNPLNFFELTQDSVVQAFGKGKDTGVARNHAKAKQEKYISIILELDPDAKVLLRSKPF
jgi:hypothetical protein